MVFEVPSITTVPELGVKVPAASLQFPETVIDELVAGFRIPPLAETVTSKNSLDVAGTNIPSVTSKVPVTFIAPDVSVSKPAGSPVLSIVKL